MEIALVLGLLITAIILFSLEKIPVELSAIGVIIALLMFGLVTPVQAFQGFGSEFIIMLASLFVVGGSMQKAGVLRYLSGRLIRLGGKNITRLKIYLSTTVSFTSAFMNNTTVTALYVSPVLAVSKGLNISPSKLLMPVAFASIIGGTCTVIGTSTNIAVNSYLESHGFQPFGMFDFTAIGLVLCVIGIVYIVAFGPRLLPDRGFSDTMVELKKRRLFSELTIEPASTLVGKKIRDTILNKKGIQVLSIERSGTSIQAFGYTELYANDVLKVEGSPLHIRELAKQLGVAVMDEDLVNGNNQELVFREVLVVPGNDFVGEHIREASFPRRFGVRVLAIHRDGATLADLESDPIIKSGDILLVYGPDTVMKFRENRGDFVILHHTLSQEVFDKRKAIISCSFFLLAILLSSFDLLPTSVAFMLAAFGCVVFGCLKTEEIYQRMEWPLLILIGSMTAFGTAMTNSGTAEFLAGFIRESIGSFGPHAVLSAFALLTVFLTQPMSNAAAALVVLPVALATAAEMHVNPITFALVTMLSASISLITPFEPSCLLVLGPGNYKFKDFLRFGFPLTIVLVAVIIVMALAMYPL